MLAAQVMCVTAGAKAEQRPPRACRPELSKDLLSKQCSGRSGRNKGRLFSGPEDRQSKLTISETGTTKAEPGGNFAPVAER